MVSEAFTKENFDDSVELEEMSAIEGGPIDSDDNDTSWSSKATKDFNKKEKKQSKLRGTKLTKEQLIQKVMNYLLTQGTN